MEKILEPWVRPWRFAQNPTIFGKNRVKLLVKYRDESPMVLS